MMITRGRRSESGFTLVEVMIAMIAGVIVLGASTTLVLGTMRSMRGTELRDGMDRRGRFVGIALQRDVQQTGIAIDARATFGTIGTYADTLVMLRVPFFSPLPGDPEIPAESYVRSALVPAASGVGNCGAFCLEVTRAAAPAFQIRVGELAYVELNSRPAAHPCNGGDFSVRHAGPGDLRQHRQHPGPPRRGGRARSPQGLHGQDASGGRLLSRCRQPAAGAGRQHHDHRAPRCRR